MFISDLFYSYLSGYLDTDQGIHGNDEEGIEVSQNVPVDEENAGVVPQNKEGEEVTDD